MVNLNIKIDKMLTNALLQADLKNITSDNNIITIGNTKVDINNVLHYTYYHPLLTNQTNYQTTNYNNNILMNQRNEQPINNYQNGMLSKYIYEQFLINLFNNYSDAAMDFSIKKNLNETDYIDELLLFDSYTADFLKYMMVNDEKSCFLRGGAIIEKSDGTSLPLRNSLKNYIVQIMHYYINMPFDMEDEYDFYVPYYPFIKLFLYRLDNDNNVPLNYYSIVKSRFRNLQMLNINETKILDYLFSKYRLNNLIIRRNNVNIENNENNVNNANIIDILNKIKYIIMLYNIFTYDKLDIVKYIPISELNAKYIININNINNENNDDIINKFVSVYTYKALYNINNNINDNNPFYIKIDNLLIFYTLFYQIYKLYNNNDANDQTLINIISPILRNIEVIFKNKITSDNINSIINNLINIINDGLNDNVFIINNTTTITRNINNNKILITISSNLISRYNRQDNDQAVRTTFSNILKFWYTTPGNAQAQAQAQAQAPVEVDASNITVTKSLLQTFFITLTANVNIADIDNNTITNIHNMYNIQTTIFNVNNNMIVDNANNVPGILDYYINKINTTNSLSIIKNINVDIRYEVSDLNNFIKNTLNVDIKNVSTYKAFISMLPTYYNLIFKENDDMNPIQVINNGEVVTVDANGNIDVNNNQLIAYNPLNENEVNPVILQQTNTNYVHADVNEKIAYYLFWTGISMDTFDKLPLHIKTILQSSCFTFIKYNKNGNVYQMPLSKSLTTDLVNANRVCFIAYHYSNTKTIHDIIQNAIKSFNTSRPSLKGMQYSNNIGLDKQGNIMFIKLICEATNLKYVIDAYIKCKTENSGNASLDLSPKDEILFITILLRVMGYTTNRIQRKIRNEIITVIKPERVTIENLISKIQLLGIKDKSYIYTILNQMLPLISYLNYKTRTELREDNVSNLIAGIATTSLDYDSMDIVNALNSIDLNLLDLSNFELLNTDIFKTINNKFKTDVAGLIEKNPDNVVNIIANNLHNLTEFKAGIYKEVYDKLTSGSISLNEIIDNINIDCNPEEESKDYTKLFSKILEFAQKSVNLNTDVTAKIVKTNLINNLSNVVKNFECQLQAPITYLQGLSNIETTLNNNGITIDDEVKQNFIEMVDNIYTNTFNIVKSVTVISAVIQILKAYKMVYHDISDTVINQDLINNLTCVFKTNFLEYLNRLDNTYHQAFKKLTNSNYKNVTWGNNTLYR